jgi:hypothetical protein
MQAILDEPTEHYRRERLLIAANADADEKPFQAANGHG